MRGWRAGAAVASSALFDKCARARGGYTRRRGVRCVCVCGAVWTSETFTTRAAAGPRREKRLGFVRSERYESRVRTYIRTLNDTLASCKNDSSVVSKMILGVKKRRFEKRVSKAINKPIKLSVRMTSIG